MTRVRTGRIALSLLAGGALLAGLVGGASADDNATGGRRAVGIRSSGLRSGGGDHAPSTRIRSSSPTPSASLQNRIARPLGGNNPFSGGSSRAPVIRRNEGGSAPTIRSFTGGFPSSRVVSGVASNPRFGGDSGSRRTPTIHRFDGGVLPFAQSGRAVPQGVPVLRSRTAASPIGDSASFGAMRGGSVVRRATPSATLSTPSSGSRVALPSTSTIARGRVAMPGTTSTISRGSAVSFGGATRVLSGQRVIGTRRSGSGVTALPSTGIAGGRVALPSTSSRGGHVALPSTSLQGGRVALPSSRTGTTAARSWRSGQTLSPSLFHLGGRRAYPAVSRLYGAAGPSSWRLGYHLGRRHGHAWHGGHGWYLVVASAPYAWDWCLEPVFGFGTVWVSDPTPWVVASDPGAYIPLDDGTWIPADSYGPQVEAPYEEPWDESGGAPYQEPWDLEGGVQPDAGTAPAAPADESEAMFARGVEAFLDGKFAEAAMTFHLLSVQQPENGQAWMALTHARFAQLDYRGAADALAKAAALGAFPAGYRFDPTPLYRDGSFPQRLQAIERHVQAYPLDANAWLLIGYFRVALGQEQSSRAALDRVLQLRRNDPTAIVLIEALQPAEVPELPRGN